jgi:hypothetical protein
MRVRKFLSSFATSKANFHAGEKHSLSKTGQNNIKCPRMYDAAASHDTLGMATYLQLVELALGAASRRQVGPK